MLRLIGIVLSIGFADSLNPTTVGPALVLAAADKPRETVAKFTLGVFAVYFLGGLLIALGPGELVIALVPRPSHNTVQVIEVLAGIVLIIVGTLLWRHRVRLAERKLPAMTNANRTGWVLGASIMALELPTAFPYFGALAAIVGAGNSLTVQFLLILLFNVCFIAPLLVLLAVLEFDSDHASELIARGRALMERHWPLCLAVVAIVAGGIVIALGATGIIMRTHFFRRGRRLFGQLLQFK